MYFSYQTTVTQPKEAKFHLDRCRDILKKMKRIFGASLKISEKRIDNLNSFGNWFRGMGNLKSSEDNLIKAMTRLEGLKHEIDKPSATQEFKLKISELEGDILNNFAKLYENMGDLPKAEEYYKKSLKVYQCIFGNEHSNVAHIFNNLGMLYRNMGKHTEAEEYILKSLKILFGEHHIHVALSFNNLGLCMIIWVTLSKQKKIT